MLRLVVLALRECEAAEVITTWGNRARIQNAALNEKWPKDKPRHYLDLFLKLVEAAGPIKAACPVGKETTFIAINFLEEEMQNWVSGETLQSVGTKSV
jgi:hypothetical protein